MMVLAFLVGSVGLVMGATTVTDRVGVDYSEAGSVYLLGMTDYGVSGELNVSLTLNGGSYGDFSTAGAQAQPVGASSVASGVAGNLIYTLYTDGGTASTYKITVETQTANAAGLLRVNIESGSLTNAGATNTIKATGGGVASGQDLGTVDKHASGTTYAEGTSISITLDAADLITGIGATNSWTGITSEDGAQVVYHLVSNPGSVTYVDVLYTLTATT